MVSEWATVRTRCRLLSSTSRNMCGRVATNSRWRCIAGATAAIWNVRTCGVSRASSARCSCGCAHWYTLPTTRWRPSPMPTSRTSLSKPRCPSAMSARKPPRTCWSSCRLLVPSFMASMSIQIIGTSPITASPSCVLAIRFMSSSATTTIHHLACGRPRSPGSILSPCNFMERTSRTMKRLNITSA